MKKIEAYLRPNCIGDVINSLHEIGIEGISLTEIKGYGQQKGHVEHYRGAEYTINLLPKIKIELFIKDTQVSSAIKAITKAAQTGEIGDGKIFISPVEEGIRIRTGETGETVI